MNRHGKIARLPGKIREELNTRLDNGEEGPALLDWLNALPEVQASLQQNFNGAPISKQNLSEWRQGGFREWQIRLECLAQAGQMAETADEMGKTVDPVELVGALATVLASRYAAVLNRWDGQPDGKVEAQLHVLRILNRDLALLQKTVHEADRRRRELEQAELKEMQIESEDLKKQTLNMLIAIPEREALEAALNDGERGRKLAEMITAVKYDLPLTPEEQRKLHASLAESEPVQPGQTKSKPDKAGPKEEAGQK